MTLAAAILALADGLPIEWSEDGLRWRPLSLVDGNFTLHGQDGIRQVAMAKFRHAPPKRPRVQDIIEGSIDLSVAPVLEPTIRSLGPAIVRAVCDYLDGLHSTDRDGAVSLAIRRQFLEVPR